MTVVRTLFVVSLGCLIMACGPSGGSKKADSDGTTEGSATTTGGETTAGTATGGETTAGTTTEGTTTEGTGGTAATGGTTEGTTTGGSVEDACLNNSDLPIVSSPNFMKQVEDCGTNCIGSGENCVANCLVELANLTQGCAGCFDTFFGCIVANCLDQCSAGAGSPTCSACYLPKCGPAIQTCSGVDLAGGGTTEGSTTEGSTTEGSTTEGSTTEGSTTEGGTTDDNCIPQCQGKICGDDTCGGVCGECDAGFTCSAGFQCKGGDCNGVTFEGCCSDNKLQYCEEGALTQILCANNEDPATPEVEPASICGWKVDAGYYDCGGDPKGDPSGANPIECPAG